MPKTDQQRAEVRRRVEAQRAPEKDRSGHEQRRGKKKASVSVSRQDADREQFTQSLVEMRRGSDRVSAILGCAMVENELRSLITDSLVEDADRLALFEERGAPLGTFSSMILVAKGFGLVTHDLASQMDIIRNIRNVFAHTFISIDFDHQEIAKQCDRLPQHGTLDLSPVEAALMERPLSKRRQAFENAAWFATTALLKKTLEIIKRKEANHSLASLIQIGQGSSPNGA